jgi:hypothetical protein
MQLKSVRGEKITKVLQEAIPSAVITVVDGALTSLAIGNVHLIVSSYAVNVSIVETKKVWTGSGTFRGQSVHMVSDTEEDLQKQMEDFNTDNPSPVVFTVETKEVPIE